MDDFRNRDEISVTNAMVLEVRTDRGTTFVTIEYSDNNSPRRQQLVLVVGRDTVVLSVNNRNMAARNLEPGMIVDATFSQAMTRSIPPQAQAFSIRVRSVPGPFDTTYGRILDINASQQFITVAGSANPASIIRFNISPQTRILDPFGRRISLSQLLPGLRVRVEHATFMTLSIPPQTTAFIIQIVR